MATKIGPGRVAGLALAGASVATAVAGLGLAAVVSSRVNRSEREHLFDTLPDPGSADGIVVFGATVTANGPCHELRVRLGHALDLWHHRAAPLLIVTGGCVDGIDEIAGMTDYLVARGVPADAIVEARPGDNTRQSVSAVRALPYRRYIGVSTPFHAYRIRAEARRQGVAMTVNCPTSTPETDDPRMHSARVRSETLAVMVYALPEPIATGVLSALGRWRHSLPHVAAGHIPLRHASRFQAEINYRHAGRVS